MTIRVAPLTAAGLAVLVGLNAWLLAAVRGEIAGDDQPADESAPWNLPLSKSADPVMLRKPVETYAFTLTHPIFYKTRAPFVPPPPAPAPPPPAKAIPPPPVFTDPGLILGGVMTIHGIRKVFLLSKADPRGSWLNEGESFSGWKVQSVDASSAKLQQQDRTIELQLYPKN